MKYALIAFLLLIPACRKDKAPPTDVCIGDGFGGADCTLSTGEHAYKKPSDLRNAWMIPDAKQAQAFADWCYNP